MEKWKVRSSRTLHDGGVRLELADVELPDGRVVDHYIVGVDFPVVSLVVVDDEGRALMLHRHRFIPDRWCWDVPAGKVADGEEPAAAAVRASVEETGWRPGPPRRLGDYHPSPGISSQRIGVYVARGAERVGEPSPIETDRVEWMPRERIRELILAGEVDGPTLPSLLWAMEAGEL